jgi:hypothetical protein
LSIKVYNGAKMDFIKFKLIVKNTEKAICHRRRQSDREGRSDQRLRLDPRRHDLFVRRSELQPGTTTPETDCGDGVDNDHDGKTDCDDSDCSAIRLCARRPKAIATTASITTHDGKTDCEDSDCASDHTHCSGTEDCDDGVDNDGDGKTDCDDSDCSTNPACSNPGDDGPADGNHERRRQVRQGLDGQCLRLHEPGRLLLGSERQRLRTARPSASGASCSETEDMDNDGRGDRCDEDIDGDGLKNGLRSRSVRSRCGQRRRLRRSYDRHRRLHHGQRSLPLLNGVVKNSLGICAAEPSSTSDSDPDGDGITSAFEDANGNGTVDAGETCASLNEPVTSGNTMPVDCTTPDDSDKDGARMATIASAGCEQTPLWRGDDVVDPDFDDDGICNGAENGDGSGHGPYLYAEPAGQGDKLRGHADADQKDENHNGVGDACEISSSVDGDGDSGPTIWKKTSSTRTNQGRHGRRRAFR